MTTIIKKGLIEETGGNTESALRSLKENESIIVAIPSVNEFTIQQTVSVYDSVNNVPVILPSVVTDVKDTLYDKAIKKLWDEFDLAKTNFGHPSDETKRVLNKINALKRQDTVYFGMTDITTGEPMVLSMGFNRDPNRQNKAGNNLLQGIVKNEKRLSRVPLELTKGSKGAWSVIPVDLEDLTPEQLANFKASEEISIKVYETCFYPTSHEKEVENLNKFAEVYGLDLQSLGIEKVVPQVAEVAPQVETDSKESGEGYGF
jgi:hypothetical protein